MAHYPLVRNLKPAAVWLIAYAVLLSASLFSPPLFMVVCLLSPALLAVCGISCGLAPMAAFALLLPAAAWLLSGGILMPVLCVLYLWPFLIVHAYCFERKIPFWKSAAAHVAALAISQTALLMVLRSYVGGDLFAGGADYLVQLVSDSPNGSQYLLYLHMIGILPLPADMNPTLNILIAEILKPSARIELLNSLRRFLELYLPSFLPSLLIKNAILAGVFGVVFPIQAARRLNIPVVKMESFTKWHLNSSAGFKVLLLGLGTLLPSIFSGSYLLLAGSMMWEAFFTIFVIQGAALLDFFRTRTGASAASRWLWPCVIYATMPMLLFILGIADQFMNIRGLRKPKDREDI